MTGVDPAWSSDWTVALQRRPEVPVVAANRERLAEGGLSDAVAHLVEALDDLPDDERLVALGRLLDLRFQQNDLSTAPALVEEIVELGESLSMRRTAARAASTAVFIHAYQRGELSEARPYVAVLDRLGQSLPEAAVWAAFCRGLMARLVGDPTRALDAFRRAERMAERLGMDNELLTAREGLGVTYAELARGRDAMELARRALADAERPGISCALRYTALNNAGWVQLMLQQRQVEHTDPEELFERALALVGVGGECPNPTQDANLRINLALSALARHQPAMALAWLEPVEPVPARYEAWAAEVRARAGLALGRPELVPSLIEAPDPRLPDAERWNALMRWAAALEQQGMRSAAIDAYVAAEAIVDESMTAIGVDRGRELFLFGRQASARSLVRTLAEAGRQREALCHARLARGRALRLLDRAARLSGAGPEVRAAWEADVAAVAETRRDLDAEAAEDWRFSNAQQAHRRARRAEREHEARRRLDRAYQRLGGIADVSDCADLPRLPPSEVMLLPFPLEQDWLVFVSDAEQARVHRVAEPPPDGERRPWAALVLEDSAASIEAAERVRILPTGRSWGVPFHALPWHDGVLLDAAPVVYALDLVRADAPVPGSGTALVVADPSMNLPLAREEARAVTRSLEDAAWTVEQLEGPEITRAGVESALARATLLHYAGHGEHAGTTGWDARLLIGKSEKFGVRDVLALPRAPAAVVLSGCETGRITRDTPGGRHEPGPGLYPRGEPVGDRGRPQGRRRGVERGGAGALRAPAPGGLGRSVRAAAGPADARGRPSRLGLGGLSRDRAMTALRFSTPAVRPWSRSPIRTR